MVSRSLWHRSSFGKDLMGNISLFFPSSGAKSVASDNPRVAFSGAVLKRALPSDGGLLMDPERRLWVWTHFYCIMLVALARKINLLGEMGLLNETLPQCTAPLVTPTDGIAALVAMTCDLLVQTMDIQCRYGHLEGWYVRVCSLSQLGWLSKLTIKTSFYRTALGLGFLSWA